MKNVGIMTMHRIVNYGSFLQAYGLKKVIESLDNKVVFIDYKYEGAIINNKKNYFQKILRNKNIKRYFIKKKNQKFFHKEYNNYLKKYLKVFEGKKYSQDIDILVIGSDEVFNCLQGYPVGFSRSLFGKGFDKCKVISYAASFGHTNYEELKKYGIDQELREYFNSFDDISVRDENSLNIIKKLTGKNSYINLDPVLISNYEKEIQNIIIKDDNYILLYAYTDRLTKEEEKYIKKFAQKYHKTIISVGFYQKIADKNLIVDPFEALVYFKKADYVITDTFHGSIFAIIMKTKFCSIIRKSNNNKLAFLLEKLKQNNRIARKLEDIDILYKKEIDFSKTNMIIETERKKALDYLKRNI